MKKILVIVLFLLLLTGCAAKENEREAIVKSLVKNEILEGKKYKEIDVMNYSVYSREWCKRETYYIYENKDGDKVAITFDRKVASKPKEYDIVIYYDVQENKNMEYYDKKPEDCSESLYMTNDDKPAKTPKYILKQSKNYYAVEDGKKYDIEEKGTN